MLLIGSQALNTYIPLSRQMHDWDILLTQEEFSVIKEKHLPFYRHIKTVGSTHIYEYPNPNPKGNIILELHVDSGFTPSDKLLVEKMHKYALVQTPIGMAFVPHLQDLYDIKRATAVYIDEPKHKADVELMEKNFRLEVETKLFHMRLEETKERVGKQEKVKYDFFHQYHIPEYIKHDYLHEVIADGMGVSYPTYKRIIDAEVNVSEDLFNKLTHDEKVSLMVEESLVLALERWFIPNMVEKGINYVLIELFFNNNEGLPTYKLLKHCCITGLKGEKEYITGFARENFFEIEKAWIEAKQKIKKNGGLSVEFYDKLFKVREEYKKSGKSIAIV